jgi:flagellar M-ring protein FliF
VGLLAQIWQHKATRLGFLAGTAGVLLLTAAVAFWALSQDYQVLFVDLASQDAAAMIAELDKMKVPYKLGEGGDSILVPKDMVYKTRVKMMGKDLPLRGAVGFELFNSTDFGMTEFAQKVNYQRALQGELTRTIMAIEEVQFARVHLAIPEQGLFKKNANKAKASITLGFKPGKRIRAEQVTGIQRLVSAAVPDIRPQDVTVLDQHGVPLSAFAGNEGEPDMSATRLDLKRSTEEYLLGKVLQVLERAFGPGQAIASVDVALNLDQVRVTTEDVLPAKSRMSDTPPTGVVVRERQVVRDAPAAERSVSDKGAGAPVAVSNLETEYQVGRRTEHLQTAPGAIRNLSVAVVVRKALEPPQLDRIREVVAMAIGYNKARGDAIAVYSIEQFAGKANVAQLAAETVPAIAAAAGDPAFSEPAPKPSRLPVLQLPDGPQLGLIAAVATLLLTILIFAARRNAARPVGEPPKQLTDKEREALLANVQAWVSAPVAEAKQGSAEKRR